MSEQGWAPKLGGCTGGNRAVRSCSLPIFPPLPPAPLQFQLSSGVKTVAADGTVKILSGDDAVSQLGKQSDVVAPILQVRSLLISAPSRALCFPPSRGILILHTGGVRIRICVPGGAPERVRLRHYHKRPLRAAAEGRSRLGPRESPLRVGRSRRVGALCARAKPLAPVGSFPCCVSLALD